MQVPGSSDEEKKALPYDYQRIKLLGTGGQGSVSLVKLIKHNNQDEKRVDEFRALKRIYCSDLDQLNLALREALSVLQIGQHVNVVKCFKFFIEREEERVQNKNLIDKESVCIMYEYCERGSLADMIKYRRSTNKIIPWKIVLEIFKQTVSGIHFIHSNRICHRDMVGLIFHTFYWNCP